MINNLPYYQAIIIANGNLIDCKKILKLDNTFIIVTDGAYDKCRQLEIIPNLTIGDKDSIINRDHKQYLYIADQNTTDLEKAILYCKNHNFNNILILGAFGGELDHSLNNIMLVAKYVEQNMKFSIIDQYCSNKLKLGILLKNGSINFTCPKNSYISILPLPLATISTTGLEWELKEAQLSFDFTSARNSNIQENIQVSCSSGKSIIIIDYSLSDLLGSNYRKVYS